MTQPLRCLANQATAVLVLGTDFTGDTVTVVHVVGAEARYFSGSYAAAVARKALRQAVDAGWYFLTGTERWVPGQGVIFGA